MALVSSAISSTVMQFFKQNGEKYEEDVNSIRAIRFVLSGKKKALFCVLISQPLFSVKTFSEFATKFLFNSRVKTLSTKLSPETLQKISHIKNVMILYIVEYFSQLVYD